MIFFLWKILTIFSAIIMITINAAKILRLKTNFGALILEHVSEMKRKHQSGKINKLLNIKI